MNIKYNIKYGFDKITEIADRIGLNYLIAEAIRDNQKISLYSGDYDGNKIYWSPNYYNIKMDYDLAIDDLLYFININVDKIIKLNIFCQKETSCLNRNVIIHIPYEIDIDNIRKEYSSIVD